MNNLKQLHRNSQNKYEHLEVAPEQMNYWRQCEHLEAAPS